MSAYEVSVIALSLIVVVLLVLVAAIIRRLRDHELRLADLRPTSSSLSVGETAPDFAATTQDGLTVSRTPDPPAQTVLAFLSTDCAACADTVPAFRELAARMRQRGNQVLAIVAGAADSGEPIIEALEDAVPTVLVPHGPSTIVADYRVRAFPCFLRIGPDGVVTATAPTPSALDARLR